MKRTYLCASYGLDFISDLKSTLQMYSIEVVNETNKTTDYKIQDQIRSVSSVIGIISAPNPELYFELGIALGMGKDVFIILTTDLFDLPVDLKDIQYEQTSNTINDIAFAIFKYLKKEKSPFINVKDKYSTDPVSDLKKLIENPEDSDFMDGITFEKLIYEVFVSVGLTPSNTEGRDYGYDFVLNNFDTHKQTLIEIKKYNKNSRVSLGNIQQLLGAIYSHDGDSGILITNTEFTKSALDYAKRTKLATNVSIYLWTLRDFLNYFELNR